MVVKYILFDFTQSDMASGYRTQVQDRFKSKMVYLINKQSTARQDEDLLTERINRAMKRLSALLKLSPRTSTAVKVNKHKSLYAGRKTEKAINVNKIKSRSPNEADSNKRRSLIKQRRNES